MSNLLKNGFSSLILSTLPSTPLLLFVLKSVMHLLPLQTSLKLFCWSQLLPVFLLSLPDSHLLFPLYCSHLLPVASSESPLLLIEDDFDVPCYLWLVICITMDSPNWDNGVHTENDIVRDTLCEYINVLPMRLAECLPVCHLNLTPQCLLCLL